MLELLMSALNTVVMTLGLLVATVFAAFFILAPIFIFQIRNILKDMNKKMTKLLDN